jgi:tetraacyldisaccharide 4'-kinase
LGWLYSRLAGLHHRLYDAGWRRVERAPLPVLSLGNITAGGTGKTPAARWLAASLAECGRPVAIVSRGYGGERDQDPMLVALRGQVRARADQAGDEAIELGTDPAVHAMVVGRDRVAAARLAATTGASVAVLDDGFQHRRLHRDLDLVLVDAVRPWDPPGRGLPAGPLREPVTGLARADLVLLTRAPDDLFAEQGWLPPERIPAPLRAALERLPAARRPLVAAARHRPRSYVDPEGAEHPPEALAARPVLAVSGIAAPEAFEASLRKLGARVVDHLAWPDHHRFRKEDADAIEQRCRAWPAAVLITTAKDRVRWPEQAPPPGVLTVRLEVAAEPLVLGRIRAALGACPKEGTSS